MGKKKYTEAITLSEGQREDFLDILCEEHNKLRKILLTQEVRADEQLMLEYLDSLYYVVNLEGRISAYGMITKAEFDIIWAMGQQGGN